MFGIIEFKEGWMLYSLGYGSKEEAQETINMICDVHGFTPKEKNKYRVIEVFEWNARLDSTLERKYKNENTNR